MDLHSIRFLANHSIVCVLCMCVCALASISIPFGQTSDCGDCGVPSGAEVLQYRSSSPLRSCLTGLCGKAVVLPYERQEREAKALLLDDTLHFVFVCRHLEVTLRFRLQRRRIEEG